jgi:predicted lysophospholipase L1 biosynthesis ABC-type transport system permease subunit
MDRPDYAPPVWRQDALSRWIDQSPLRTATWLIGWLALAVALLVLALANREWIWGIFLGVVALLPTLYQAVVYLPRAARAQKRR